MHIFDDRVGAEAREVAVHRPDGLETADRNAPGSLHVFRDEGNIDRKHCRPGRPHRIDRA